MNRRLRRAPSRAAASPSASRQPRSRSPSGMSTPITPASGKPSTISASVAVTRIPVSRPPSRDAATQPPRQASTPTAGTSSALPEPAGRVAGEHYDERQGGQEIDRRERGVPTSAHLSRSFASGPQGSTLRAAGFRLLQDLDRVTHP